MPQSPYRNEVVKEKKREEDRLKDKIEDDWSSKLKMLEEAVQNAWEQSMLAGLVDLFENSGGTKTYTFKVWRCNNEGKLLPKIEDVGKCFTKGHELKEVKLYMKITLAIEEKKHA